MHDCKKAPHAAHSARLGGASISHAANCSAQLATGSVAPNLEMLLLGALVAAAAAEQLQQWPQTTALAVQQQVLRQVMTLQELDLAVVPRVPLVAPTIPGQWQAIALVSGSAMPGPHGGQVAMSMLEDSTKKRRLQLSTTAFPYAPAGYPDGLNSSTFIFEGGETIEIDGDCLSVASNPAMKFSSLFNWLPGAHDAGSVMHNGKRAHKWALSYPSAHFAAQVLFGADNLPVAMTMNYTNPATQAPASVHYEFSSFIPALPPDWDATWSAMELGCKAPPRCQRPASTQPVNMTMYIFHPPNEFDIAGQDLADATGDNIFVCQDLLGGKPNQTDHNYQ